MLEEIFDSEINLFEGVNFIWLNEYFIKENFFYVVSIDYIFILDKYKLIGFIGVNYCYFL